jgi:hypothetical protein
LLRVACCLAAHFALAVGRSEWPCQAFPALTISFSPFSSITLETEGDQITVPHATQPLFIETTHKKTVRVEITKCCLSLQLSLKTNYFSFFV